MLKVINLTPHDVVIVDDSGKDIKLYLASGQVARVNTQAEPIGEIDGIQVVRTKNGDVDGLPVKQPDTVYLVSLVVAQALRDSRTDVYVPDTGPGSVVRDDKGQIIGVKRLMQL